MTTKRKTRLVLVVAALGIGTAGAVFGVIGTQLKMKSDLIEAKGDVAELRKEILSTILSEKVETIVGDADSDQERCLRIARWISSNIANREPEGRDELGWWAYRSGLCGAKARLFVRMCTFLHIPARVFNIYDMGGVKGKGHSCVQAYYDGQWHFYDVMYAGVFIRDGKVLSWEEIISEPEKAMENMVVFEKTLDRWGNLDQNPVKRKRVNNTVRMNNAYSAEILRKTQKYGFWQPKQRGK